MNFRRFNFSLVILLFITSVIYPSCKSNAVLRTNDQIEMVKDTIAQIIANGDLEFAHFACKAKVRLESELLSGSGKMNIRMKRDSVIWFNFKKVSIEGVRGLITPSEYIFLYRQEKQYEQGGLRDLAEHFKMPIDFNNWQIYLAGSVPQPDPSSLVYEISGEHYRVTGAAEGAEIVYTLNAQLELVDYQLTDGQNRTLAVELDNYHPELRLYKKRKLTFFNNKKLEATIEMEQSDIEWNVPKNMPFTIPDHYTRL